MSCEHEPRQTCRAQQVFSGDLAVMERGGDHESPLTLRVRQGLTVMTGWAAAPEGTSAAAADRKVG